MISLDEGCGVLKLPYAFKILCLQKENISTGASPLYTLLQLHVVNFNQAVLKSFKIRKQVKKWCGENCQEPHTSSFEICFSQWEVVKAEGRSVFVFYLMLVLLNLGMCLLRVHQSQS